MYAMPQRTAYDDEVRRFSPPSSANAILSCDLLIVGGGLSGLSAADAAVRHGLNVIVLDAGAFGEAAASGLNAGQFLTSWVKPVSTMLAELADQEQREDVPADLAGQRAQRRVRAFPPPDGRRLPAFGAARS